jgi:MFS family permease
MPDESVDRSYRALLEVPRLGRVVASMGLARIGQSMVGVALVLFALAVYDSPALAGIVTFASVVPGLLIAPIAGALLDRHGRVRLMILDYVVALVSLAVIGALALAGLLPAPLLVLIVVVTSLTSILSIVGLRTIFPIMVPSQLWERVNAVDSNGYVVATILGPPLAASLVAILGAPAALIAIALPFGLAALVLLGLPEPETESASTGDLLADAWAGVRYAWGNKTIRGLGFSLSILNLGWGVMTIVIPLVVLRTLGYGDAVVGLVFAASGVSGMVSAFLFGRLDTRGREWPMLVIPIALMAPLVALLLPAAGVLGPIAPETGLALLIVMMFLFGLLNGSTDIALFTVRQRRTDPAWMGRAFAVSMAFNFMGFPIGAAIAGALVSVSMEATIWFGVVACVVAAVAAAVLVPAQEPVQSWSLAAEPVDPRASAKLADPPEAG